MISRRAFLQGTAGLAASAALGSALARVAAASDEAPKRLLVFFAPNGMKPRLWTPPTTGHGWEASPILQSIEPVRSDTLVITGLQELSFGENHQASSTLRGFDRDDISAQPSFDQVIANALGDATPLRSLQLGSEATTPCRQGVCSWMSRLSWVKGGVPVDIDVSPAAVFRRLYGATGVSTSVLDFARADLARYKANGSGDDKRRLEAFADGLRDAERRLTAGVCNVPVVQPDDDAVQVFGDDEHIREMLDLAVLALQCDRTRVLTYMIGNASGNRPLDFLGIPLGHHMLSHMEEDAWLTTASRWVMDHWTYLVRRLAETPDVDGGRLLDNTYVLFVSEFGDGALHVGYDMPILLAGGRGGPARGQHLRFPNAEQSDLWISLLHAFGQQVDTFGATGTKPLIDLTS